MSHPKTWSLLGLNHGEEFQVPLVLKVAVSDDIQKLTPFLEITNSSKNIGL